MSLALSAYTEIGIFFGRHAHGLGEGLEEAAVITEAAFLKGFGDTCAFAEGGFCDADAPGGDIFADGGAGGLLEDAADVGLAEEEAFRQLLHGDGLGDILVDIGQNIVHLMIVFVFDFRGLWSI